MKSSSTRLSSFMYSLFLLALFLPGLSSSAPEEKPEKPAEEKAEREGADKAKGTPGESFEDLHAQFEKEKDLEAYRRAATVEKFGKVPTKESVAFLIKLYDQEKAGLIFESVSRALGRIGTLEAAKAVIEKGIPTLLTEVQYELHLGNPNRPIDPAESARAKEGKMSVIGEALSNPLEPAAEEWLLKRAIPPEIRKEPQVLEMLLKVIAKLKTEKRVDLLLSEIKKTASPELQASILESLASVQSEKVVSTALHFVNSKALGLQLAAYEALKSNEPAKHRQHFLSALKSPHWQLRVVAVDALADAKDKELVKILVPLLKDKDLKIQVAVVKAFLERGGAEVIEPLFKALDTSPGRVQDDIADALARLTGKDFGTVKAQWESWWAQNKDKGQDFTAMPAEQLTQLKESGRNQGTVLYNTYFGLRVLSSSVAFLIDCSESMDAEYIPREKQGTASKSPEAKDRGKTVVSESKEKPAEKAKDALSKAKTRRKGPSRLEIAKKELMNVIQGLKDGDRTDVFRFNSAVVDFVPPSALASQAKSLPKLDPKVRGDLDAFIQASKAEGLTNLFGAIKLSFDYPELDTLYILSDGAPTLGVVDHQELLAKVARLNQRRKLKINTISFNPAPDERKLLQELAQRNYGVYVER
jgi:HEAT repeat protein